jgi:hypothetical protein
MTTPRGGLYAQMWSMATKCIIQFKWRHAATRKLPFFRGKESKMSWDDAYNQLEQELGREPNVEEVQIKMLMIAKSRIEE